ncbi:M28 family peptidase [Phenylobacterium sp.]|uniref:M28 family peptidase n=1 Tax=Phenylobacterium sp. TaxID=1871053 RepID=UPI0025D4F6D8|nr:M28 family peptidase [Phenylobacterium sp.]
MRRAVLAALLVLAATPAAAASRADRIADPDTRAWWRITEHLASDAMEGRDIGSPGHRRAGRWVAERFKAAGLKPAGDHGTYFQSFPVHESRVEAAEAVVMRDGGAAIPLRFLREFSVRAADDLPPTVEGGLIFAGYCRAEDLAAARGKVVLCLNTRRAGLTSGAERVRNAQAAGAVALVQVDDPGFTIEPFRWPAAYARTITLADAPPPPTGGFVVMTLSAEAFARLAQGSGHDGAAVLQAGGAKQPLPVFDLPGRLTATFRTSRRDFTATNVLAVLPGADPRLAAEHLVISAHLDGYGYGEPVKGDRLYNGALDDAAYVGTLIRFAEAHHGQPLKRSVLFAAFTGEEKGLLGATWFVRHPTVPKASLVADLNLDQLRPLFPLKLMTVHALDDSTLGATVRDVAGSLGIRTQPDPEPERSLVTRADHYPFLQIGVPATGFIFGYEPGTQAERRYREWYQVRYHRPQDDLTQPMDFQAAGAFNRFFYRLVETVAEAAERPAWTPGSRYAPKP